MRTFAYRLEELLECGAGNGGKRWSKEKFANKVGIHSDTLRNWRQGRTIPASNFLLEACICALEVDQSVAEELRGLAKAAERARSEDSSVMEYSTKSSRSGVSTEFDGRLGASGAVQYEEPIGSSMPERSSTGALGFPLASGSTGTIQFESIGSKDRPEVEEEEVYGCTAKHSVVPGLLYLEHRVDIDIINPEGDAKFVFSFDAVNIGAELVLGESKAIWIENGSPKISILPTRPSHRLMRIEMRRDYPHMKQFFCAFSTAVEPGGRISYGYELSLSKMFTKDHYWETKINNLTRRVRVRIKHDKGRELMNAYVESEGSSGLE
ncbi:MAG: hypothetical protein KTR25_04295 [Myxococcales bacterium]|nr:hypothetical protein [Myxococcales bacterium]